MDKELPVSPWPEWKIVEKIGEGSFGKVYKAQRCERGKTFYSAIKVINIPCNQSELNSVRAEIGDDQSTREYFKNLVEECIQEISTMEYFRGNSYIVSVEDFKVMEYLDAIGWEISIRMEFLTSFMDYCAEKQLTEQEVIRLGLDLSKALSYLRKLNIIHRDIKPENIFVSRFGDFKLGDFGIARELERTMSSFSKKGTYSYMAPEMYRGEKYDNRADIYSLGIVLYKLMNHNRLPFMNLEKQFITYRDKENALTRRMSGEQLKNPVDAGGEFTRIILKACAYNADDRYQNPEDFYRDLDDLQHGRSLTGAVSEDAMPGETQEIEAESVRISGENSKIKTVSPQAESVNRRNVQSQINVSDQRSVRTAAAGLNQRTMQVQSESQNYRSPQESKRNKVPSAENEIVPHSADRPDRVRTSSGSSKKRRKKKKTLSWEIFGILIVTVMIIIGLYVKLRLDEMRQETPENLVNILEDEKYTSGTETAQEFSAALEKIKNQATTISDNVQNYDWIGVEGDKLKYFNHDNGEYMKVLVYPAKSEDKVYEEYFYWDEKLFFAYIWYDEMKELYYYDNGRLIRWVDKDGVCHDNEIDNEEFVKRGKKYWEKSVEELK